MAKFLSSFGMRACFDLYSTCERNPFFDLNKSSDMLGSIIKVVPREEHPLLPLGKHLSYEKPAVMGFGVLVIQCWYKVKNINIAPVNAPTAQAARPAATRGRRG